MAIEFAEETEVAKRESGITSITFSRPGAEPVTVSKGDFDAAVEHMTKPEPSKDATYELIGPGDLHYVDIRALIDELVDEVHDALREADIQPAWMIGKKPDVDGHLILGKMKRCTELDRLLHDHDALLLLNREAWETLNEAQRRALIDHELCHLDVACDKESGDPKYDAHGRKMYRTRRHDLEEFRGVIERHGCYLQDVAEFVKAALDRDPNLNLFEKGEKG